MSQIPLPPRAAAGEDDGSDEVSPTELHSIAIPCRSVQHSQQAERSQGQQRAPHSGLWGWKGSEGVRCGAEVGNAAGSSHL